MVEMRGTPSPETTPSPHPLTHTKALAGAHILTPKVRGVRGYTCLYAHMRTRPLRALRALRAGVVERPHPPTPPHPLTLHTPWWP